MSGDMIDELAELIWAAVNDVAGQSGWRYDDLEESERNRLRGDVVDAALRHPGDEIAQAILAASRATDR